MLGLSVNEAMCQAVPVIATDAVGAVAGGLIRNGATGLVVPEGDRTRLASALRRLLVSPEERAQVGAAGYQRVMRTTQVGMADAFERAFDAVLTLK